MSKQKLILPISILLGCIILGGFYYASQVKVQNPKRIDFEEHKLSKNLSEKELEDFFRNHTIANNYAVAIMQDFSFPIDGTAYLGTIHGYPDNKSVCEELIAPYNDDPSLSTIPGALYYCKTLKP